MAVLAAPSLSVSGPAGVRSWLRRVVDTPGALVLAAACPLLFLHLQYQPSFTLSLGSAKADVALSDVAVLLVALAALADGLRRGFGPLGGGRGLWLAAAALLLWILAATIYPVHTEHGYAVARHLVTAAKFAEYALLALAVPLLLRTRRDLELVLLVLLAWSALATVIGALQFLGVGILHAWPAGRRQPSFLGVSDFAALSGAVLVVSIAQLVFGAPLFSRRRSAPVALAAGGLGFVLAGASAGVLGLVAACALAALVVWRRGRLTRRHAIALAAVIGISGLCVLAIRAKDFNQFTRFVGIERATKSTSADVQTYAQRTVLLYIGMQMLVDHPWLGVGWQNAEEENAYRPYLPAARRRFPNSAPQSFPSHGRSYGIQNAYLQAAAEMGIVGGVLFALLFAVGTLGPLRDALRLPAESAGVALTAAMLVLLTVGLWNAQGIVAGIPLAALTWLALGLGAAAPSLARAQV